jgi:DNA-binding MarR family transcriptional regulator
MQPSGDGDAARFTGYPTWLLSQAGNYAGRLVAERLASVGARGRQYRLLAALDELGPASQAALGRHSGIHLSDLVAELNDAANEGLVKRTPDPNDRRRNVITITAAGRRRMRTLDGQLERAQRELLAPLSAADQATLRRLLSTLVTFHAEHLDPA